MQTIGEYPELVAQWHPTKNGNLTPSAVSAGSSRKIWWRCFVADDHEWCATPIKRIGRGDGCSCCKGFKVVKSNCLATTHPQVAVEWHPTKNEDVTPYHVTFGNGKIRWWVCNQCKREYSASCNSRTKPIKNGCPYCAGRRVCDDNCLATRYPQIAAEWHPTKNGDITPRDIVAKTGKKYWWICSKGHEYQASADHRCSNHKCSNIGTGCSICNESRGEKRIRTFLDEQHLLFKEQWRFTSCRRLHPLPFDFVVQCKDGTLCCIEYQGIHHYQPIRRSTRIDPIIDFELVKERDLIKRQWCKRKGLLFVEISYLDLEKIETILQDLIKRG